MRTVTIEVSDADYTAIEDWVRRTAEGAPVSKGNPLIAVQNVRFAAAEPAERGEPSDWEAVRERAHGAALSAVGIKAGREHDVAAVILSEIKPLWPAQPPASGEAPGRPPLLPLSCLEESAAWPETVRDWLDSMASGLDTAGAASEAMHFEGWAEQVRQQPTTARDQAERRWREEVNQPPASGEPPELPADWREAVEGALQAELAGAVPDDDQRQHATSAVLNALAPLVLGERLRAERLRRALEDSERRSSADGECRVIVRPTPSTFGSCRAPIGGDHYPGCPFAALAADPPAAALAELLGLPGKWEKVAKFREQRKGMDDVSGWHRADAAELRAVLAKLGLPAGEEADDG